MGSTKATRREKRDSYGKGKSVMQDEPHHISTRASTAHKIMVDRKSREKKDAITRGAVNKSNNKAKETMAKVAAVAKTVKAKPTKGENAQRDITVPYNGRVIGRQLIRWSPQVDQVLMLCMEYELKKIGVEIPYDAIARRLACEKGATGASVQQHLNKLRVQILNGGGWVPPLPGRIGHKKLTDIRGVRRWIDKSKVVHEVDIEWEEDISKFVNTGDFSASGKKRKLVIVDEEDDDEDDDDDDDDGGSEVSVDRYRIKKVHRSSRGDIGLAGLLSDDEFDPSMIISARATRGSVKRANKHPKFNSYASESDEDNESEAPHAGNEGMDAQHEQQMMLFNDSEEEQVDRKIAILQLNPVLLARFPEGISGVGDDDYYADDVVIAPSVTGSDDDDAVSLECCYDSDSEDRTSDFGEEEEDDKDNSQPVEYHTHDRMHQDAPQNTQDSATTNVDPHNTMVTPRFQNGSAYSDYVAMHATGKIGIGLNNTTMMGRMAMSSGMGSENALGIQSASNRGGPGLIDSILNSSANHQTQAYSNPDYGYTGGGDNVIDEAMADMEMYDEGATEHSQDMLGYSYDPNELNAEDFLGHGNDGYPYTSPYGY